MPPSEGAAEGGRCVHGYRLTASHPGPQQHTVQHGVKHQASICNFKEHHEDHAHHHHEGFGDKNISLWGSCVLNFNNITGPAVIVLPLLFQQAGWLLPCVGLVVMWIVSSFAATMLCESMQRIPGNKGFARRFEYCTLVRHYFGNRAYYAAQIGYNAGLTASNIAAMIVTSQVLDAVASRLLGTSFAVSYASWPLSLVASADPSAAQGCKWGVLPTPTVPGLVGDAAPACNTSVISLGYLLSMAMCIPMGHLNLDGNMGFQWLSMLAQFLCSLEFARQFLLRVWPDSPFFCAGSGPSHTPLVGLDVSQVVGICVFAYSYVSTIPSWANEKQPHVSVNKAIWLPSSVGAGLNILLGLLGAWAYILLDSSGSRGPGAPHALAGTDDMLNLLDGHADPRAFMCTPPGGGTPVPQIHVSSFTELCVYIWGIGGYVPGIPILAIMVRYNLQSSGVMGHNAAFFWAVVAPWIVAAFFYQAEILLQFCSWVALLCQGFINLLVPILLYRQALLLYPTDAETAALAAKGGSSRSATSKWAAKGAAKVPKDSDEGARLVPESKGTLVGGVGTGTGASSQRSLSETAAAALQRRPAGSQLASSASAAAASGAGKAAGHQGLFEPLLLHFRPADVDVESPAPPAGGDDPSIITSSYLGPPLVPPVIGHSDVLAPSQDTWTPARCAAADAGDGAPLLPARQGALASRVGPTGDEDPEVNAVPAWLLVDPLLFATALAWFVTGAVLAAIGFALVYGT